MVPRICKTLWGEDNPNVEYGLACTSGPLGGDAQIAALMCLEDLGGVIFFIDPLSAHPHQADIDSLVRLCICGNVILCVNPSSAMSVMHTFKRALEKGSKGMVSERRPRNRAPFLPSETSNLEILTQIPSFFETLESPAVEEYKLAQEVALKSAISRKKDQAALTLTAAVTQGSARPHRAQAFVHEDRSLDSDVEDADDIVYSRPVQGNRSSTLMPVRDVNEKRRRERSRNLMKSLGKSVAIIGRKILDSG